MKKNINIAVDLRLIIAVLSASILVMLAVWKPWGGAPAVRKVTVSGHSTIKAEPDFYQFNPSYSDTQANKDKALGDLTAKVKTITDKLRELGVEEKYIELQTTAHEQTSTEPVIYKDSGVSAHLSIKAANKDLAKKVQDYLLTTSPEGSITPYPSFSDEKRKKIEAEARDKAIDDAKLQAGRTAKQLGAKLGKVIEVKDAANVGIMPYGSKAIDSMPKAEATLPIFSGEQEISFSVEAIFEIR